MGEKTTQPKISGTKEWSVESVNCINGCGHRCRYCYARADAVRRRQCPSFDEWGTTYHHVRPHDVRKRRRKIDGRVMFPTTHDIEPEFLEPCMTVLENLLRAGNDVLVVSKPHPECIKVLCAQFMPWRDQITFRFSIGAISNEILSYWEPGAPLIRERLASLLIAWKLGFRTSVSAEPLLEYGKVRALVDVVGEYVTDTIWIGKMNQPRRRCPTDTDEAALVAIEAGQTDEAVHRVYEQLKDHPQIRWKDSYKKVLGLEVAIEAGLEGK